jgi:hypothetical protein
MKIIPPDDATSTQLVSPLRELLRQMRPGYRSATVTSSQTACGPPDVTVGWGVGRHRSSPGGSREPRTSTGLALAPPLVSTG